MVGICRVLRPERPVLPIGRRSCPTECPGKEDVPAGKDRGEAKAVEHFRSATGKVPAEFVVAHQPVETCGERGGVAWRNQQSIDAVTNDLSWAARTVGADDC